MNKTLKRLLIVALVIALSISMQLAAPKVQPPVTANAATSTTNCNSYFHKLWYANQLVPPTIPNGMFYLRVNINVCINTRTGLIMTLSMDPISWSNTAAGALQGWTNENHAAQLISVSRGGYYRLNAQGSSRECLALQSAVTCGPSYEWYISNDVIAPAVNGGAGRANGGWGATPGTLGIQPRANYGSFSQVVLTNCWGGCPSPWYG